MECTPLQRHVGIIIIAYGEMGHTNATTHVYNTASVQRTP